MDINSPIVSVIVPVYNVENYLIDCLDSLIAQSMDNIEIILVDDGSTDDCPSICDAYAQSDKRIKVIHQENKGLSDARNAGIGIASAGYIMFVDSDDYVDRDFCLLAYKTITETNSDMVVFGYDKINVTGTPIGDSCIHKNICGPATTEEALCYISSEQIQEYAWNKIYRKELFAEIRYPSGELWEDMATTYLLINKCRTVFIIPDILYHYRIRPYSLSYHTPKEQIEIIVNRHVDAYEYLLTSYPKAAELMRKRSFKDKIYYCTFYRNEPNDLYRKYRQELSQAKLTMKELGKRLWLKKMLICLSPKLFSLVISIKQKLIPSKDKDVDR